VQQIRGLLDSGLTTEIIRRILPFLDDPNGIHLPAECLTAETAGLLRREADRLQQRIDCLTRNRDAIRDYLAAIQPGTVPAPGTSDEELPATQPQSGLRQWSAPPTARSRGDQTCGAGCCTGSIAPLRAPGLAARTQFHSTLARCLGCWPVLS